jgi:hypothetical protein
MVHVGSLQFSVSEAVEAKKREREAAREEKRRVFRYGVSWIEKGLGLRFANCSSLFYLRSLWGSKGKAAEERTAKSDALQAHPNQHPRSAANGSNALPPAREAGKE